MNQQELESILVRFKNNIVSLKSAAIDIQHLLKGREYTEDDMMQSFISGDAFNDTNITFYEWLEKYNG